MHTAIGLKCAPVVSSGCKILSCPSFPNMEAIQSSSPLFRAIVHVEYILLAAYLLTPAVYAMPEFQGRVTSILIEKSLSKTDFEA